MSDPLKFDSAAPAETIVQIGNDKYLLMEATEDAAAKYTDARVACTHIESAAMGAEAKLVRLSGLGALDVKLLNCCLFYADADGKPRVGADGGYVPVPEAIINSWRHSIVKKLAAWVREVSGLEDTKKSKDDAKN